MAQLQYAISCLTLFLCVNSIRTQTVPDYNPIPYQTHWPIPSEYALSKAQINEHEIKAYDGDGNSALQLATYYGLVLQDVKLQNYWWHIGVVKGNAVCFQNVMNTSLNGPDSSQKQTDINLLKWAWRKYNKVWEMPDKKEIHTTLRTLGINVD